MKKILLLVLSLLIVFPAFSDEITFSSRESSVRLRDGEESVMLRGNAVVSTGSLVIRSESINLSGTDWRTIECTGDVTIEDEERGISIHTSSLYYDRIDERLLLSSYFEIEDRTNEMSARSSHLEYDMQSEILTLTSRVSFSKINNDDVIRGEAEMLRYDRDNNLITLSGACRIIYKGDEYNAERIELDIDEDTISLTSGIRGTVNG